MQLVQSQPSQSLAAADLPASAAPGLYVHIPFCFHKCHYCDFYSITRQTPERMGTFVELTLKEGGQWAKSAVRVQPRTVFFGGGTPSLLPLEEMRKLLRGLRDQFDFSQLNECTVEANPATVSLEYCQMLREEGVDRLSFGAQSFNPAELKMLERHHDPHDVPKSIEIAKKAGFKRMNLDLIYAIPGQDLSSWARSLKEVISLDTPHISCYGLTYEPNTPMAVRKRLGQFTGAEDPLELEMMRHARQRLSAQGLHPYEISNYAKAGEECRHNLLYWNGGNYIGLGPSAASHVEGWRWKNRPHLGEWERAVSRGDLPATDLEQLSEPQRMGEWVMLRLRLSAGIDFAGFAVRWERDAHDVYADELKNLSDLGLIEISQNRFVLSDKGLAVADAVAAEFLRV
jgi:oxygen-independent coproporphyrinogen-3 oxidase